ncbi:amino acid ABC transporter permease/ATP-binding protein [Cupriavidus pauculus]|jgi:polar amino acid transport system permease protein|uniref:Amino acid ABC transporter permease/ATP-binding protein n=1 Tax=Cupriavidus pauculus TaxID=82633 RepID=A0A5P2H0N9_9BURK|nr:amino acid ABC transporter permease/ATP-binding protein [Cupriavidus pauculus]QET01125.1 amino acid ABC transporter permease/ATP-binding protein [Cupriavidus pauculus]
MELFFHYLTLPYLLAGAEFTLGATAIGLVGGTLIGLVLAAMQLSRFRPLATFARGYAVIFRGTPLILQMVFVYDALPHVGIKLPGLLAAGVALAFNEATFIAEMFRAGVLGVDRGQLSAGQALGMTPSVLMRRIVAPQALRAMIPAMGNEAVSTLKNSSLASVIAVQELTLRSTQLASSTFDFFSIFFASGVMYLVLTGAVGLVQVALESRFDLEKHGTRTGIARWLPWVRAQSVVAVQPPVTPAQASAEAVIARADGLPDAAAAVAARAQRLAQAPVAVRVNGVTKAYGAQAVLTDLSLTIGEGEVVALLGPSGSGKSTLLRCINHLEGWDAGHIHVHGKRLGYRPDGQLMRPADLARERASLGVGMVFQQFNLFAHLTARENIAGPLRWVHGWSDEAADARALGLLERVGLSHRADALPRHMSGGQQQRVAIARALAPHPRVLLLDEPTSALDPERVNEVLDVIRTLAREDGLTMIISTHQLRFAAEVADRVVFLADGRIIESGPARQVLTQPSHPQTARFLSVMTADA